jgi:hypothetical protein
MKRLLSTLLLLAAPTLAVETEDCRAVVTHLTVLYELRNAMLSRSMSSYDLDRLIDRRLDELREPLPGGSYRWVRWVRPESNGPTDKHGHSVVAVNGSGSDSFEASGNHAFAVRVVVPQKRSLFNANHAVYVGNVRVNYTAGGRPRTKEEPINNWMNPDTSRSIDLGAIADHVDVTLDASTAHKNVKQALVEIHFKQAVPEDDPANPAYSAIQALGRIRSSSDPRTIDTEIASVEHGMFPGTESVPMLSLIFDLRRADELMRSSKTEEQEKGDKLLKETLRRLR